MTRQKTRKGCPRQDTPSLQLAHPSLVTIDDVLDEIATLVAGTFVVVVETSRGRRRQCYLSAAAAQKAAARAVVAGHSCSVFLAELRPLWRLEVEAEVPPLAGEG